MNIRSEGNGSAFGFGEIRKKSMKRGGLKILYIAHERKLGGATLSLLAAIDEMRTRGHEIYVMIPVSKCPLAQELQKRDGQSAEEIWKRNLKKCLIGFHLDKQEQKDLEKLGSMLGYLDVDMQLNALDYYLEQLKESSLRATEVSKTQKKLYQSMGILGGAALAVLVF